MRYLPEDQDFERMLDRIKSLPEDNKKKVRDHLLNSVPSTPGVPDVPQVKD